MKLTSKIYQTKAEQKKNLHYQMRLADDSENLPLYFELKEKYEALQKWFDELETVAVSFMIGYRSYYREVVQIGKTFFHDSQKMTKGNGFRCVEIIPAITEKMKEEMIADSYYY